MTEINKKILALCDERGWTPYKLANMADITHSSINSFLNRDSAPKVDMLQRICDAFGITLAQFFMDDEKLEFLNADEKLLVSSFRMLSVEKQQALLKLMCK